MDLNTLVLKEKSLFGRKKAPAGMGTPQHPGFTIKTHFLGEKKAPAGMGTPQHPGFRIKTHFWGEKKAPAGMGTPQHPGFKINPALSAILFHVSTSF